MNSIFQQRKDIDQQKAQLESSSAKLPQDDNGTSSVLNSWKEIAAYLGRGVRTVQRWERNFGLPVHRPNGRDPGATLAIPSELEEWLRHTPIRSGRNGKGEGFTSVPQEKRAPYGTARARTLSPPDGRRLILSVDDEPALLYTRQKLLEAEGYTVLSAADGEQALQLFAAHAVDLVLLDYVMPKIDGGTVAKEMKRHKPLVPIIMVSGNHVESASSCADFFIAKGKEPALLLERIARFSRHLKDERCPMLRDGRTPRSAESKKILRITKL